MADAPHPLAAEIAKEFEQEESLEDTAPVVKKELIAKFRAAMKEEDDDALYEAWSDLESFRESQRKKLDS